MSQYERMTDIIIKNSNISTANSFLNENISEKNLMIIIYSDKLSLDNVTVKKLIEYTEVKPNVYNMNNVKYWDDKLNIVNSLPSNNKNVVDINATAFYTQTVIKNLFLLDVLSEFYGFLYNLKNTNTLFEDYIIIKSRYGINSNGKWILYSPYQFKITLQRYTTSYNNTVSYRVDDVNNNIDQNMVEKMLSEFKEDILYHIKNLNNVDIINSNKEYLDTIKHFYIFSRLKLNYILFKCYNGYCNQEMSDKLKNEFSKAFFNLKNIIELNKIGLETIHSEIIMSTIELNNINQKVWKNDDKIKKNKKKLKNESVKNNESAILLYTAIAFFILITGALAVLFKITNNTEIYIIILMIVIFVYIFFNIYIYTSSNLKERFVASATPTTVTTTPMPTNIPDALNMETSTKNLADEAVRNAEKALNDKIAIQKTYTDEIDRLNEEIRELNNLLDNPELINEYEENLLQLQQLQEEIESLTQLINDLNVEGAGINLELEIQNQILLESLENQVELENLIDNFSNIDNDIIEAIEYKNANLKLLQEQQLILQDILVNPGNTDDILKDISNQSNLIIIQSNIERIIHEDELATLRIDKLQKESELAQSQITNSAAKTLYSNEEVINRKYASEIAKVHLITDELDKKTTDANEENIILQKRYLNAKEKNIESNPIYQAYLADIEAKLKISYENAAQIEAEYVQTKKYALQFEISETLKAKADIAEARTAHLAYVEEILNDLKNKNETMTGIGGLTGINQDINTLKSDIINLQDYTNRTLTEKERQIVSLLEDSKNQEQSIKAEINDISNRLSNAQITLSKTLADLANETNINQRNEKILKDLIDEIRLKNIEYEKYRYITRSISSEKEISNIKNILLVNINDSVKKISDDIIKDGLNKEKKKYRSKDEYMMLNKFQSNDDIEIKRRDKLLNVIHARFILNMLLIIVLVVLANSSSVNIILLIVFAIVFIFYLMDIYRIVHTRSDNKYWEKPELKLKELQ